MEQTLLTIVLALVPAAAAAEGETVVQVEGDLVSVPYVEMTLAMMRRFFFSASAVKGKARTRISERALLILTRS